MLTTHFMHVHIPRTAGTTLRAVLGGIPGVKVLELTAHLSYGHMAKTCKGRKVPVPPAFAVVRNPYSYYVSQWTWLSYIGQKGLKDCTFREYLELVKANAEKGKRDASSALNYAPMSFAWRYLGVNNCQYLPRFEAFPESVAQVLARHLVPGLATEEQILGWIEAAGRRRRRPTPDGHYVTDYRACYDDATRRWVEAWDAEIIERFGYQF